MKKTASRALELERTMATRGQSHYNFPSHQSTFVPMETVRGTSTVYTAHRRQSHSQTKAYKSPEERGKISKSQHFRDFNKNSTKSLTTFPREDTALLEDTLKRIRVQVNSEQLCGISASDIDK